MLTDLLSDKKNKKLSVIRLSRIKIKHALKLIFWKWKKGKSCYRSKYKQNISLIAT